MEKYKFSKSEMMYFYTDIVLRAGDMELNLKDISDWISDNTNNEYKVCNRKTLKKLIEYVINHNICFMNDCIGKELGISDEELDMLKKEFQL